MTRQRGGSDSYNGAKSIHIQGIKANKLALRLLFRLICLPDPMSARRLASLQIATPFTLGYRGLPSQRRRYSSACLSSSRRGLFAIIGSERPTRLSVCRAGGLT